MRNAHSEELKMSSKYRAVKCKSEKYIAITVQQSISDKNRTEEKRITRRAINSTQHAQQSKRRVCLTTSEKLEVL